MPLFFFQVKKNPDDRLYVATGLLISWLAAHRFQSLWRDAREGFLRPFDTGDSLLRSASLRWNVADPSLPSGMAYHRNLSSTTLFGLGPTAYSLPCQPSIKILLPIRRTPDLAAQGKAVLDVDILIIVTYRELLFDSGPGQYSFEQIRHIFLVFKTQNLQVDFQFLDFSPLWKLGPVEKS